MNPQMIHNRIQMLIRDAKRLTHQLETLDTLDIQRFPRSYDVMVTKTALLTENVCCRLRNLIFSSTQMGRREYMLQAAEAQDIHITMADGILSIQLPALLPHKGNKYSSKFLLEPLDAALEQFQLQEDLPKFLHCTVCIIHVLDENLSSQRVLDHDNLQNKQLLDTVAVHVLTDDNGILCDVHYSMCFGTKAHTELYIMEKNRFPVWLQTV